MKYFLIFFLLLIPAAVSGATAQCPRYSVSLEGTTSFFGVTYTEILKAHKVGGGSGYNGRWKVISFEQFGVYPSGNLPVLATDDIHNIGMGVQLHSKCTSQGNVVRCLSTSENMFLEVKNNKVRMEGTSPWHGSLSGSTMTWKFHLENPVEPALSGVIAEAPREPVELTITNPQSKGRYVFSPLDGKLILKLEVKTRPESYAESVEWVVPEMEGVERSITGGSLTGSNIEVVYKNLPANNSEFGKKKVTATLKVGACTATETREVQFFYPRDSKNNPGGTEYNWFYYWKQTPAAKPFGQKVNIEFGGTQFDVCKDFHVPAMFKPAYMYKTIHVCDLSQKLGLNFATTFPKLKRSVPATVTVKSTRTTKHIDTFAVIMRHEYIHFNAYHTWREGKTLEQMNAADADQDGIPDSLEPGMEFDETKFQTYWGNDPEWKKIGGDEEFLAYEAMYDYVDGTYDAYDWGKPGKNWP